METKQLKKLAREWMGIKLRTDPMARGFVLSPDCLAILALCALQIHKDSRCVGIPMWLTNLAVDVVSQSSKRSKK